MNLLETIFDAPTNHTMMKKARIWHSCKFIPEVRFDNPNTSRSFMLYQSKLKVAMVNYVDIKRRRIRGDGIKKIRKELGEPDALILSGVGEDMYLDSISIEDYHKTALEIGANAVTTIDDYVYSVDDENSNFQLHNLCRLRSRARTLTELAGTNYSIIGLVVGKNQEGIKSYIDFLAECGITDFAYPCGDLFKNNNLQLELVRSFLDTTKGLGYWRMLLGTNSKVLSKLNFNCHSSNHWSFDAYHHRVQRGCRKIRSRRASLNLPEFAMEPIEVQIAIHNLTECYRRAEELTR